MFKISNSFSISQFRNVRFTAILISIVLITCDLYLLQFPLTNVLGYEYSAVNSLLIIILSGIFTITWYKRNDIFSYTFFSFLIFLALIPFLISIANSIIGEFCSVADGVLFYSIITLPSVVIGFSIGIFSIYISRKFIVLFFLATILFIGFLAVFEIYFYPQVYFYNPLIAFFPGAIYDEALSVNWQITLYRLLNIVYFTGIIFIIFSDKKQNNKFRNSALIIICSALFFYFSPSLGFATNFTKLENLLPQKISTDEFTLHISEEATEDETQIISLHAKYYFEWLKESINETPSKKIEIFIFESSEQKRKYFGSGAADVAKPWQYQIFLNKHSWQSTLKHELAHIFSAEFGSTLFKLASGFNPFLIEGLATSQDPFRDEIYVDHLSALAVKYDDKIKINNMLNGFRFFSINSSLTYTYAGSFIKFLIDSFGIDKFKNFYSTSDFIKTYGISSDSVINAFKDYLNEINIINNEHSYFYYFGRQSITQKICPRFIGKRLAEGWAHIENKNPEQAKIMFKEVLQKTINYSAVIGMTECFEVQDSLPKAVDLIQSKIEQMISTPYYYLLKLRLADLYSKISDFRNSEQLYSQLSLQKPNISIDIITQLRLKLIEKNLLNKYLSSNDSIKYEILTELNKDEYFYPSIPALLNLAINTNQNYNSVIKQFNKTKFISDFYSAYAVYKLSNYMLLNFDFVNARKMAALARRFKAVEHLSLLWDDNFEKANWFYYNAGGLLKQYLNESED